MLLVSSGWDFGKVEGPHGALNTPYTSICITYVFITAVKVFLIYSFGSESVESEKKLLNLSSGMDEGNQEQLITNLEEFIRNEPLCQNQKTKTVDQGTQTKTSMKSKWEMSAKYYSE